MSPTSSVDSFEVLVLHCPLIYEVSEHIAAQYEGKDLGDVSKDCIKKEHEEEAA